MREQELETKCCEIAKAYGWLNFKGSSRNGGADRIFFRGGYCFLVEFKAGKNRQSKNQKNESIIMEKSNYTPYYLVYTEEMMVEALRRETARAL